MADFCIMGEGTIQKPGRDCALPVVVVAAQPLCIDEKTSGFTHNWFYVNVAPKNAPGIPRNGGNWKIYEGRG
jgi:hypothetical protein